MNNVTYLNVIPDVIPPFDNGNWTDMEQWGASVVTTWNPQEDQYIHWTNESLQHCLLDYLKSRDLVIGYNYSDFDERILSGYGEVDQIPSFSLMDQVQRDLGYRIKLQNLGLCNKIPQTTSLSLIGLLKTNPDFDKKIAYNVNKIYTMNRVIERAVEKETLWHYKTGEDRYARRFSTSHWKTILNGKTRRF